MDLKDWTRGGELSLAKAMLEALGANGNGLELYQRYFRAYTLTDSEANISCLDQFDGDVMRNYANTMYKIEEPKKQPDWFSFYSRHDVNRVARLSNHEVVVYLCVNSALDELVTRDDLVRLADLSMTRHFSRADGRLEIEPFYDFRCYSERGSKRFFLLNKRRTRLFEIPLSHYRVIEGCVERALRNQYQGNSPWIKIRPDGQGRSGDESLSLFGALKKLVDPASDLGAGGSGYIEIANCNDLLCANEHALYEALGRVECLIVYKCQYHKSGKRSPQGKALNYTTLAVVAASPEVSSDEGVLRTGFSSRLKNSSGSGGGCNRPTSLAVICIMNKNIVHKLDDAYAVDALERRRILKAHYDTIGQKERLQNRNIWIGNVKRKLTLEEAAAAEESRSKTKRKRTRRRQRTCRCSMCKASDASYAENMNLYGPERLCTTRYTLSDLLRILNLSEHLKLVPLLTQHSIATMDIESRTIELDMEGPSPGPNLVYDEYDEAVLEGHSKKVQRPVMIAHADCLTQEAPWFLTAENDSMDAIYSMMRLYWTRVVQDRQRCVDLKTEIALPIRQVVDDYRKAFFSYYSNFADETYRRLLEEERLELETKVWNSDLHDEDKDVLAQAVKAKFKKRRDLIPSDVGAKGSQEAWKASLPGQLETRLNRITSSYIVFTFYG